MKLQRLDTETRQKQIIEAALAIIHQHGLAKLTIKELAKRVNISEQAIYRHFENKLAILKALLLTFNQALHQQLASIPVSDDPIAEIRALIREHLNFFARHPEMAALVYPEEVFQTEPVISSQVQETIEKRIQTITEIIEQAQAKEKIKKEPKAESLALIIFGAIRILITQWRFSGLSFDLTEKGEQIANDLLYLIQNT